MNNIAVNENSYKERIKASELSFWLLSRGISTATTKEIAEVLVIPKEHVSQRLAAPKKRGEIVSLAHNLWAPIPPEYLTWGAPPAIDFIDSLMNHMDLHYYVGWLSAASFLGASHHAPQVFQVAVSKAIRNRIIGRSKLMFFHRRHINQIRTYNFDTKSGKALISSRETTILDIANDIGIVGGVDNAANLIIELCEADKVNIELLVLLCEYYPTSAIRRLGYIMENFTVFANLDQLVNISKARNTAVSLLDPQYVSSGTINKRWQLKINREVEPDV